jgi:hypothetical protein
MKAKKTVKTRERYCTKSSQRSGPTFTSGYTQAIMMACPPITAMVSTEDSNQLTAPFVSHFQTTIARILKINPIRIVQEINRSDVCPYQTEIRKTMKDTGRNIQARLVKYSRRFGGILVPIISKDV